MDDFALPTKEPVPFNPLRDAAAIAWAVGVACCGLGIGWLIGATSVGVFGNLVLLALGFVGGFVAREITGRPVAWVGWVLVVAMFVAFFFTLVGWLRFGGFVGGESWAGAFGLLEKVNFTTMVPGLVCAGFGSYTAFFRVAR